MSLSSEGTAILILVLLLIAVSALLFAFVYYVGHQGYKLELVNKGDKVNIHKVTGHQGHHDDHSDHARKPHVPQVDGRVVEPGKPTLAPVSNVTPRVQLEPAPPEWDVSHEPSQSTIVLPLKVAIRQAFGLQSSHGALSCVCEIQGKSDSRIQTEPIASTRDDLVWNHEQELPGGFTRGDSLVFAIWGKEDQLVGMAVLASDAIQANGFEGELPLLDSKENPIGLLSVSATTCVWARNTTPFFAALWTSRSTGVGAMRNDFTGDVGFSFVPRAPLIVTSLGRQAHNALRSSVQVSLWSADSGQRLAHAVVGPTSAKEGGYSFGALQFEVNLEAGREYRLSQSCTVGMPDWWFDGAVSKDELLACSASLYVDFIGSVFREGHGFPDSFDDDAAIPTGCRRAGMLNFKMLGSDPSAEGSMLWKGGNAGPTSVVKFSGDTGRGGSPVAGGKSRKDMSHIRLVCMSPPPVPPQEERLGSWSCL